MSELQRVFFDSNSGPGPGDLYWLRFDKSEQDLASIPGGPREGMRVLLDDIEGLEMEAVLLRDENTGKWIGRFIPGTIRYYNP